MTHRWLTRALVAVAVPALLVPALSSSATAAPKPPAVPTLDAVSKIYPHLADGTADVTRKRKVRMPQTSCKGGAVIKGATGQEAVYAPDIESMSLEDVEALEFTGKEPMVSVAAEVFPTSRVASQYLRASLTEGEDCAVALDDDDMHLKKIRFQLGAERWGFQLRMGTKKAPLIANFLLVRSGKTIVTVTSTSLSGKAAPSIAKSVDLTRLALKTAR